MQRAVIAEMALP